MIRRILLAYDGSAASVKACELAFDLAQRYGARLVVLSVARPPEFGDDVETEAVIENSRAYHEGLLEPVKQRAATSGLDAAFLVTVGHPTVLGDRVDRADRLAGAAVDALLGVDVALADAFVDAVDRALVDARLVVDVDAGAGDDVRHVVAPPQPFGLLANR